jgi:transcriptional/translational regulatory protein YebC/TACO1
MTDNRNRTVSEVRHAFNKNGGNLGTSGSVAFMFHKQGRLTLPEGTSEEAAMEATLAAEPEDIVTQDDGTLEIVTSVEGFGAVKDALVEAGIEPSASDVGSYPDNYSPVDDVDTARKVLKLFDMLEDLDDVQNVYSNADFSDAVMAELE